MKRFKHRCEYALVKLLDIFFNLLPAPVAFKMGEGLGWVLSKVIYKRHALILDNLAHAFPEKTPAQREKIAAAVWRNLGRTAMEFIRLPRLLAKVKSTVVWQGTEHLEKALREKSGVILLGAHFSNWEILGALISDRFGHLMAIGRPMRNPFVDAWVLKKRTAAGMKTILHREAVKASLRWVKAKNFIGILVDQNLYTGGEFVEFFGRPAATTTLPALLYSRTDAPAILVYCLREGSTFRVVVEPPILVPVGTSEDRSVSAQTQAISKRLEEVIRRTPENWFWIHNRWKRKQ